MIRVVFAGEMSRENGFVGHFRTLVGRKATQKSSDGLSGGGGLALPWHIPSHGAEGRGKDGTYVYILWKVP